MIIKVETVVYDSSMVHFVMIEHAADIQTYREKYYEIRDAWYAEIPECQGHYDMLNTFIAILKKYNINAKNVAYIVEDVVIGFKSNE